MAADPTPSGPSADGWASPSGALELVPRARFGRFTLTRRLGAGGFGEVWEVVDPTRSEPVALKILSLGGPARRARWAREVAALDLARLPGVVTLYDHGEAEAGRAWISMATNGSRS